MKKHRETTHPFLPRQGRGLRKVVHRSTTVLLHYRGRHRTGGGEHRPSTQATAAASDPAATACSLQRRWRPKGVCRRPCGSTDTCASPRLGASRCPCYIYYTIMPICCRWGSCCAGRSRGWVAARAGRGWHFVDKPSWQERRIQSTIQRPRTEHARPLTTPIG